MHESISRSKPEPHLSVVQGVSPPRRSVWRSTPEKSARTAKRRGVYERVDSRVWCLDGWEELTKDQLEAR